MDDEESTDGSIVLGRHKAHWMQAGVSKNITEEGRPCSEPDVAACAWVRLHGEAERGKGDGVVRHVLWVLIHGERRGAWCELVRRALGHQRKVTSLELGVSPSASRPNAHKVLVKMPLQHPQRER